MSKTKTSSKTPILDTAKANAKKKASPKKVEKPLDLKLETIQVRFELTDAQYAALGKASAAAQHEIASLEAQLSSIKKEYSAKIEGQELTRNMANDKTRDGFEMKPISAVCVFDKPEKGRKSYFYHDPENKKTGLGEFIREEAMTTSDMQKEMFQEKPKTESQPALDGMNPVIDSDAAKALAKVGDPVPEGAPEEKPSQELLLLSVTKAIRAGGVATVSFVQRQFNLGHGPAKKIMDKLQELGVLGELKDGAYEIKPDDTAEETTQE